MYRNDLKIGADGTRTLHFTDVTAASGIKTDGYGMGVADIDNDGCVDLYLTYFGCDQLWRNNCDGTFTDVTVSAGIREFGPAFGVVAADFDADGGPRRCGCAFQSGAVAGVERASRRSDRSVPQRREIRT